jgi:2',3'-cyclic-nucleotide 2'-phosphodiesterase (5'-nucleotidase family)
MNTLRRTLTFAVSALALLLFVGIASARTATVLILHTNDIHDHLRPDYDGSGGLPFVSGYIKQQRAARSDVLVLDAGDVAEKGDMVAFATGSELTFEAFGRVGYHAWTPGNHDHDFGVEGLRRFAGLAGEARLLCSNLTREDGTLEFPAAAVFAINGVRVGVIGMIVPRKEYGLDPVASARAMAREAELLEDRVDLTVALCHIPSQACAALAREAPQIDVFVSGHSHEVLREAVAVEPTGALIVQAGSYAEYVGRLELTIDLGTRRIVDHRSELVPMRHDAVPCDIDMLQWIQEREEKLVPESRRPVAWTSRQFDRVELGMLGAAALREATGADIALCHSGQVIRDTLPKGVVDLNAVFRAGGERGRVVVETRLSGAEIESYLRGLQATDWGQTQWAGFRAAAATGGDGRPVVRTTLEPGRIYRVVMPELEWSTRFQRLFARVRDRPGAWTIAPLAREPVSTPVEASFTDAVARLVGNRRGTHADLGDLVAAITAEARLE